MLNTILINKSCNFMGCTGIVARLSCEEGMSPLPYLLGICDKCGNPNALTGQDIGYLLNGFSSFIDRLIWCNQEQAKYTKELLGMYHKAISEESK